MRAVTFQSMLRTSSPIWYSRTSENSIPCPLKTERYSPEKREFTSPRVWSSRSLTWRRMSDGTPALGAGIGRASDVRCPRQVAAGMTPLCLRATTIPLSRTLDAAEDLLYDILARDLLRLRLVCRQHPVAEDVGRDRLDVVRRHERAAPKKRVRARCLRQRDRRAWARAELHQRHEVIEPVVLGLARRVHDVDDVIHDPVVHVQLR